GEGSRGCLQRAAQISHQFVDRQRINLAHDAAHLLLQAIEVTRNRRQYGRVCRPVERDLRLILEEVERNILLAGEQVGRTHLCPQTAPHHVLQEAGASNGGILVELHDTFEQGAETQRIDTRPHQREELPALAIKLHVDIDDRAQLEAPEIDGRPDLQTAYGLMEVELDENRVAVGVGHGLDLIVVQLEHRVGYGRLVEIGRAHV